MGSVREFLKTAQINESQVEQVYNVLMQHSKTAGLADLFGRRRDNVIKVKNPVNKLIAGLLALAALGGISQIPVEHGARDLPLGLGRVSGTRTILDAILGNAGSVNYRP